jgi:hypothetical protein
VELAALLQFRNNQTLMLNKHNQVELLDSMLLQFKNNRALVLKKQNQGELLDSTTSD